MKNKLIIIIIIIILSMIITIIIYKLTVNKRINILVIGDGLASGMTSYNINGYNFGSYLKDYYKKERKLNNYYEFSYPNINSKELIQKINNNTVITNNPKITIQQAISKANIIIISIGIDELALKEKITTKDLKEYYDNVNEISSLVRKINKKGVFLLGLYQINNTNKIVEINHNLEKIANKYSFKFINLAYIIDDEHLCKNNDYHLNYKGHKQISEAITKNQVEN